MRRLLEVTALVLALAAPVGLRAEEAAPPAEEEAAPPAEEEAAPPADGEAPTGVLTKAPQLVTFVEADYPPEAEAAGLTATVKLAIVIDETGKVGEVQILEPVGHGFDEAAVAAVKQFVFEPAEVDHVPAAVQVAYEYGFVLEPPPADETIAAEDEPAPVNFRGQVRVRGTREPLAGALIGAGDDGATADAEGRFEVRGLPTGEVPVRVVAPGYETYETTETIAEGEVTEVVYWVLSERLDPYETVVRGRKPRKEVTRRTLTLKEVQRIPGTRGDALRVVQTLPGVARTPYSIGPLVIRGASSLDSRTYLDGSWIPLPFHFGGLTSVFNADLLDEIELYPGNYPAKYGRALGGILRIHSRPGKSSALHGYVDVDLFDAGLLLEGPVFEDSEDTTFAIAARRSYVDTVLNFILGLFESTQGVRVTPFYWDYQAKLHHKLTDKDELSLTIYGSNDRLTLATEDPEAFSTELQDNLDTVYRFHRAVGGWTHRFGPELQVENLLMIGYDSTLNSFGSTLFFDMKVALASLRSDWTWRPAKWLTADFGLDFFGGRFVLEAQGPAVPPPGQVIDPVLRDDLIFTRQEAFGVYPGIYADVTWEPLDGLKLIPGVRLDTDAYAGNSHFVAQPRGTALYSLTPETIFKAAAGLYAQPAQFYQLVEAFGNPDLGWEKSLHYAVGAEHRVLPWLNVELELFYQDRFDMAERVDGTTIRNGEEVRINYANGAIGRAYGAELYVKVVEVPGVVAWLPYTLSRSEQEYDLGEGLELFYLDQTHNFVARASWEFAPGWSAGASVRFVTGVPLTPFLGAFYDADADLYVPIPGDIASGPRADPFFSLDVRVDKKWTFQNWMLELYLDVTNLTNYRNVESYRSNFDYTDSRPLPGLPIFPSLGVKAEF